MEKIAILDGLQLLGTYEVFSTHEKLRDGQIMFECEFDERQREPRNCDDSVFQSIDLREPKLPKTRVIYGQISDLGDSI